MPDMASGTRRTDDKFALPTQKSAKNSTKTPKTPKTPKTKPKPKPKPIDVAIVIHILAHSFTTYESSVVTAWGVLV